MDTGALHENSFAERRRTNLPAQPGSIEESGLSFLFLVELVTKTLFRYGRMKLLELVSVTKLSIGVLEPVIGFMRQQNLCMVSRATEAETNVSYELSGQGKERATEFLLKNQYIGPAPVSLMDYIAQVEKQSLSNMTVTSDDMQEAFRGIVVRKSLLPQFGSALNSGRAIMVYGPSGSGKTYLAERISSLLKGEVAIPHAITVDNDVIQVFDPTVHRPLFRDLEIAPDLDRRMATDSRWVLCRRPVTKTGGELTLSMLELDFDENSRFYHAPPQVKAQNGIMIIDDLGRQLVPAINLMNRWIVPLDRKVDYLTLHTGKKFMVPFDVIVVFSTNLTPSDLADEAFLRRLGYKIFVGELSESEFQKMARQVCAELDIPVSESGLDYLLLKHKPEKRPLLACTPMDILRQLKDKARYERKLPELSRELIDWSWSNYFFQRTSFQRGASDEKP